MHESMHKHKVRQLKAHFLFIPFPATALLPFFVGGGSWASVKHWEVVAGGISGSLPLRMVAFCIVAGREVCSVEQSKGPGVHCIVDSTKLLLRLELEVCKVSMSTAGINCDAIETVTFGVMERLVCDDKMRFSCGSNVMFDSAADRGVRLLEIQ